MLDRFTFTAHRIELGSDGSIILSNHVSGNTLSLPAATLNQWQAPPRAQRRQSTSYAPDVRFDKMAPDSTYGVIYYHQQHYTLPCKLLTMLSDAIVARQAYRSRQDTPRLSKMLNMLGQGCAPTELLPAKAPVYSLVV